MADDNTSLSRRLQDKTEDVGNLLVNLFHMIALFVIGATIVWAAVGTYFEIMSHGRADLHDILLLFFYLELGAMVGIYFKTHRMPVRFLIYVSITALTRFLIIDIKEMSGEFVLIISACILILSLTILVLQFSMAKFSGTEEDI
jgi:phosphate starvation-inducible membrane PsiE